MSTPRTRIARLDGTTIPGTERFRPLGALGPIVPSGNDAFDAELDLLRAGKIRRQLANLVRKDFTLGMYRTALAELTPDALELGHQEWSSDVYDNLGLRDRKLYRNYWESVLYGGKRRRTHLAHVFRIASLRVESHPRLLAMALDRAANPSIRRMAASALAGASFTAATAVENNTAIADIETLQRLGDLFGVTNEPTDSDPDESHAFYEAVAIAVLRGYSPADAFEKLALSFTPPQDGKWTKDAEARTIGVLKALGAKAEWWTHEPFVEGVVRLLADDVSESGALFALRRVPIGDCMLQGVIDHAERALSKSDDFHAVSYEILMRARDRRAARTLAGSCISLLDRSRETLAFLREMDDVHVVPRLRYAISILERRDLERARNFVVQAKEVIAHLEQSGPAAPEPVRKLKKTPRAVRERVQKSPHLQDIKDQLADLRELILGAGLEHKEPTILGFVRRAIQCHTRRVPTVPRGSSKIGGLPDLQQSAAWPSENGFPLDFVGQVRLEELAEFDPDSPLPRAGLLSFFVYDRVGKKEEPGYMRVAKVLFGEGDANALAPLSPPSVYVDLRAGSRFTRPYPLCAITFHPVIELPGSGHPIFEKSDLTASEREAYLDNVFIAPRSAHQLLGYRGSSFAGTDREDTVLLLQCTSDSEADMCWGDAQDLSLIISQSALAARDFSGVSTHFGD